MKIETKDLGKVKEKISKKKKPLRADRFEPKYLKVTLKELFDYQKAQEKKE